MKCSGKTTWMWTIVLWWIATGCAGANDGSGDSGVGGGIFLMKENPQIHMLSEHVDIKLPDCRVRTRFVFKNEGPATSVLMIFPENGYLHDTPHYTHFKYFRAWVDGQRVLTRRIVETDSTEDGGYTYWWVKRVRFARGQTRIVINRYRPRSR